VLIFEVTVSVSPIGRLQNSRSNRGPDCCAAAVIAVGKTKRIPVWNSSQFFEAYKSVFRAKSPTRRRQTLQRFIVDDCSRFDGRIVSAYVLR
jgi:TolA C-terminal